VTAPVPTLSPSQESSLLNSLFTNSLSLPDLARSLNLTLIDLLDLIASPAIQSRLIALEQAAAHSIRVAASSHLSTVLDTLTTILDSHTADLKPYESRTDDAALTHRRRERVHIRKAATLLLRLTRFSPLAPDSILTARPALPTQGAAFQTPRIPPQHTPPIFAPPPRSALHSLPAQSSGASVSPAPTPSKAFSFPQPIGLKVHSRGSSESPSATPGQPRQNPPHREAVLVPPIAPNSPRAARSPVSLLLRRAGATPSLAAGPAP